MAEEGRSFLQEETKKLQEEVRVLESQNQSAIVDFEELMQEFSRDVENGDAWCTRLDSIEVYTMEEAPPLETSIRMICSGVA